MGLFLCTCVSSCVSLASLAVETNHTYQTILADLTELLEAAGQPFTDQEIEGMALARYEDLAREHSAECA